MVNEQRVKLMTRLAAYEEGEGKRNSAIGSYFRGDYISMQIVKSIIYGTIAFALILGGVALYDFEVFIADVYKADLMSYAKKIVLAYVGFTATYVGISYAVYAYRYRKARKRLRVYFNNLKRLLILYQREGKDKVQ